MNLLSFWAPDESPLELRVHPIPARLYMGLSFLHFLIVALSSTPNFNPRDARRQTTNPNHHDQIKTSFFIHVHRLPPIR